MTRGTGKSKEETLIEMSEAGSPSGGECPEEEPLNNGASVREDMNSTDTAQITFRRFSRGNTQTDRKSVV